MTYEFRVTGDFSQMTYSRHHTVERAIAAAKSLAKKWGWCHPGSSPCVDQMTDHGWKLVAIANSYGQGVEYDRLDS